MTNHQSINALVVKRGIGALLASALIAPGCAAEPLPERLTVETGGG